MYIALGGASTFSTVSLTFCSRDVTEQPCVTELLPVEMLVTELPLIETEGALSRLEQPCVTDLLPVETLVTELPLIETEGALGRLEQH